MATSTWPKDIQARLRALLRRATMAGGQVLRLDYGARVLLRTLINRHNGGVRVVVGHGTPSRHASSLRQQLEWVGRYFEVLLPQEFLDLLDQRRKPTKEPAVVLSFDDGLASNYEVLAPMLEDLGMRAFFFINPEFAKAKGDQARTYFLEHIYPGWSGSLVEEDYRPMSQEQIVELSRRGHLIGNHSWSHARLKGLSPVDEWREIRQSRDLIAAWTQSPCSVFAWTFAWDGIDQSSWRVASETHRYVFSACPGLNWADGLDRRLIWRSNVDASADLAEVRFVYSGLADLLWWRERRLLLAARRDLLDMEATE